jgi:hypothetical protein
MIKITKNLLSKWFKAFNAEYFNNEIGVEPRFKITKSKRSFWKLSPDIHEDRYIMELSTAYIRSERDYINSFLIMMCLIYYYYNGRNFTSITKRVTELTKGKYGVIREDDSGTQDEVVLRETKAYKYVIFTDYKGNPSIAKYNDDHYIDNLKRGVVLDNTKLYCIESDNEKLAELPLRQVRPRYIHWNYLVDFTIDELLSTSTLVKEETYCKGK